MCEWGASTISASELLHANVSLLVPGPWGNDLGPFHSHLFYVSDRIARGGFLMDTGAEVCIVPASSANQRVHAHTEPLWAVNGTIIKTYGQQPLTVDFGLRQHFQFLLWFVMFATLLLELISCYFSTCW